MKNFESAIGFDDIQILPNFSNIESRKDVNTNTIISRNHQLKYGIILSGMDTVSTPEACIELNKIGAAGIVHRFMSIEEQSKIVKKVRDESGVCYAAVGLKDADNRIEYLIKNGANVIVCDVANGLNKKIFDFIKWYQKKYLNFDLISGNTLTKESVSRHINLNVSGVRHNIGGGSACKTTLETSIGCPSLTALYFGWKAIRNWQLYHNDWNENITNKPSLLLDGGCRYGSDYVKAILAGADAIITGGLFSGCMENSKEIIEINGKPMVKYRGMASREVVEDYNLSDGKEENLFIEGESYYRSFKNKSVKSIVYELNNGLRSAMSYLNFKNLEEMKGALWTDKVKAVRISSNSLYEQFPHGKN